VVLIKKVGESKKFVPLYKEVSASNAADAKETKAEVKEEVKENAKN